MKNCADAGADVVRIRPCHHVNRLSCCRALSFALQVKKCADAGADIVRITVQGRKEAEACMKIREQLFKDG